MEEYLNILCKCPLFNGKDKNEIKNVLLKTQYKICHYKKNDFIFRADLPCIYLGIILEGSIEIQNNLESGKFINIFYKKQSEVFGGALVFSNISTCNFDVIAKEHCTILLIHQKSVSEILFKDSTIASNIINLFAKEILMLNKKIELFSYSSIKEKIAYSLLHYIKSNNKSIIQLPYSKKAWAEHLNVSRSTLSRELKALSDEGIIDVNNKTIKILNREKLEIILGNI